MSAARDHINSNRIIYWGMALLFACVMLYGVTGNYLALVPPMAYIVFVWCLQNFKSFYWFFLFCIPLSSTVYFFNDSLSTTLPDEPIMWLLVLCTLAMAVYNRKAFPTWFYRHPLVFIVALQVVWMFVAFLFSQNLMLSLKYVLAKLWFLNAYLILPAVIIHTKKDFKKAFYCFIIPTTIHAFFAFSWHATERFDFWTSNKVVKPFYENHVDYSTVLSMLFPLLLVTFQLVKGVKSLRWIVGVIIFFYVLAIGAASARAAILAVVFSIFIAFMIKRRLVNWVMPTGYLLIGIIVFSLAHNNKYIDFRPDKSQTFTQPTFFDAVAGAFTGEDMSSMERFYRWIASIRMSTAHPIVGVGPNNFYDHYKPYTVNMFATWVSRNPERSTTHNYFLFMLVEQGWPAMLLYAVFLIAFFYYAQKVYHRLDDPFYKKVTMGVAMVFAAGFVNNFFSELLETHKVGALFYISVALLVILDRISRKKLPHGTG